MKSISEGNGSFREIAVTLARALVVAGFLSCAARGLAQSTPPVLTIVPTGTNQLLITITNGTSTVNYELWTTPVLGDSVDSPWTTVAAGTGLTNFTVTIGPYPVGFYRAILDTNSIPLWKLADPNNPSAGVLNVWIDNPANGSTLN